MTEAATAAEGAEVIPAAAKAAEAKEVGKMSDADIKWREKYKLEKAEVEALKASAEKDKQAIIEKASAAEQRNKMLEDKLLDAELKSQAQAAGLSDLDFVQLIDKKDIKVVDGKVEGVDKAINDFKTRKPDLFRAAKQTQTAKSAPMNQGTAAPASGKDAWAMDKPEFARAKSDLTRGRYR
jgi:hypothetical protein